MAEQRISRAHLALNAAWRLRAGVRVLVDRGRWASASPEMRQRIHRGHLRKAGASLLMAVGAKEPSPTEAGLLPVRVLVEELLPRWARR